MLARITSSLIVGVALCLATGCLKSSTTQASFGSSSDSSSSPFKSSSKSSAGAKEEDQKPEGQEEQKETAYERDVRNHTTVFTRSGGQRNVETFQRDLATIAEGYGIADWEQTEDTYLSVGRGLADSELDDSSVRQLAVVLSDEDYDHLMLIQSGYADHRAQ